MFIICFFPQSPQEMLESANGDATTEDSNLSAAGFCDGGTSGEVESVEMTASAAETTSRRGGGRGGEKTPQAGTADHATQSPRHGAATTGGGGAMVEEDEHGMCGKGVVYLNFFVLFFPHSKAVK